jgi:uncharacterized phage-associated protein
MQTPQFNEKKATQLAAAFIDREGGSINYTKLIKLMYLADRKALLSWERTITGDNYVSMTLGPVLSATYDLIKSGRDPKSPWFTHISERNNYEVALREPCLPKNLSRAEERVIDEIFDQYGQMDYEELIEVVHKFPEWEDPGSGSSSPISIRKIFEAEGLQDDEISDIENELERVQLAQTIFGCK